MSNIAAIRKEYMMHSLSENDVKKDPVSQFTVWWEEAISSNIDEVNAMTLATVDEHNRPTARIVLLKDYNAEGFVFFTNYESNKGKSLAVNPNAALVFFWKELERQVRIEGVVEKISEAESEAYFQSRPAESKIGAWASPQSQVIDSRETLENNFKQFEVDFATSQIPKPPHWGGYKLKPIKVEFWQGRAGRLHDRIQYSMNENNWIIARLAP